MKKRSLSQRRASIHDTILVISPDWDLLEALEGFCARNNFTLWIGRPNSPDVIAVPYKIAIVDKVWLGEDAWIEWIRFLNETKGNQHPHLLVIIIQRPAVELIQGVIRQFGDAHEPVCFLDHSRSTEAVQIMKTWIDTGVFPGCQRSNA